MNLIDVIAQPRILLACAGFAVINLLLAKLEQHLLMRLSGERLPSWLAERIYLPLARVLSILLFIALAYPTLYGLHAAPTLPQLLDGGQQRLSLLLNLGFLLSLLLPVLPGFARLPSLVLPIQGLLAAALLFHWLATARGSDVTLWPGGLTTGAILIWLILAQRAAAGLAALLTDHGHSPEREQVYYETALLFLQVPALLLYTVSLGEQLH